MSTLVQKKENIWRVRLAEKSARQNIISLIISCKHMVLDRDRLRVDMNRGGMTEIMKTDMQAIDVFPKFW